MNFVEFLKKQIKTSSLFTDAKYEKYRILLIPLIVLITSVLIIVLVTIPQIYKLASTFKTIEDLKIKKTFYQQKWAELQAINLQNYRNDLNTALVALPVEKDIPGVMGEILVALGGSGMTLNGISFSNSPIESAKTEEYSIIIEVTGNEESLGNFLERVTLAPRLIKLSSIQVSSGSNKNLNASVTFATFYQLLPTSIGKVDDKLPKINSEDTQILADIEAKQRQFPKTNIPTGQVTTGKLNPFKP